MAFKTEKDMECLLAPVARTLVMADGREQAFSMMQVYWNAYDFLDSRLRLADSILRETERLAAVHRRDSDTMLACEVTRLYRWAKDTLNMTMPVDPPVDPLFYLPKVPQWYVDAYRRGEIR